MESFHVFMRQCTALYVLALHQIRHVQPCKLFQLLLFSPLSETRINIYFLFSHPSILFSSPAFLEEWLKGISKRVHFIVGMLARNINVSFCDGCNGHNPPSSSAGQQEAEL